MEIFFQTYTKTQNGLKTWISDLKLLEENLEKNLFDISLGTLGAALYTSLCTWFRGQRDTKGDLDFFSGPETLLSLSPFPSHPVPGTQRLCF